MTYIGHKNADNSSHGKARMNKFSLYIPSQAFRVLPKSQRIKPKISRKSAKLKKLKVLDRDEMDSNFCSRKEGLTFHQDKVEGQAPEAMWDVLEL